MCLINTISFCSSHDVLKKISDNIIRLENQNWINSLFNSVKIVLKFKSNPVSHNHVYWKRVVISLPGTNQFLVYRDHTITSSAQVFLKILHNISFSLKMFDFIIHTFISMHFYWTFYKQTMLVKHNTF